MQKRILFTALLLMLFSSSSIFSQEVKDLRSEDEIQITGYGLANRHIKADDITLAGNGAPNSPVVHAIRLPQISGAIEGIQFFCSMNDPEACIFVCEVETGKIIAFKAASLKKGWNDVNFDAAVEMSTEKPLLVGYSITTDETILYVFPFDGDDDNFAYDYNYVAFPTEKLTAGAIIPRVRPTEKLSSPTILGNSMIFAKLRDKVNNLAFPLEMLGPIGKENNPVSVELGIRNVGSNEISSVEVKLTGEGLTPSTKEIEIVDKIQVGQDGVIRFDLENLAQGTGVANLSIQKVNGVENLFNSVERKDQYFVYDENNYLRKGILFEHFTTEKCSNCPKVMPHIKSFFNEVTQSGLQVNYVAHHAAFMEDPYTLNESKELLPYFFALMVYAPSASIDRRAICHEMGFVDIKTPIFLPINRYLNYAYKRVAKMPDFVDFETVNKSLTNGELSMSVIGKTKGLVDKDNFYITAIVTEDKIESTKQAGFKGTYTHNGVARLFLTPYSGNQVQIKEDGSFEVKFDAKQIKPDWKRENLKVVLFAHRNLDLMNHSDEYVYASTSVSLSDDIGIVQVQSEDAIKVFDRGGHVGILGTYSSVQVYDMQGAWITNRIDTPLPAGEYIVVVKNDAKKTVAKLVIH
ncbi:Omp28-related outer membrane protein [Porphyromonas crevioricanis]|uniref:Outer membrane protein Omp28 n=3 Tax=Porphyromonas crevioricanis TaxID=393921 RepID=A0A2X4PZA8_9PORP|nr:Omp28-related outer membrane protein [Porphyromonas crevioricanis]GAD05273.1 hypothetical protein PORCRE_973 [Porphyromonas crevioricanis JCM 15906]SJZ52828.1 hypothetical protein SAMN02745203_00030 [Porphyromonas crevioricanis]SQH73227.1 Uncharacterised protein [Porphyromonas crevioricanis]